MSKRIDFNQAKHMLRPAGKANTFGIDALKKEIRTRAEKITDDLGQKEEVVYNAMDIVAEYSEKLGIRSGRVVPGEDLMDFLSSPIEEYPLWSAHETASFFEIIDREKSGVTSRYRFDAAFTPLEEEYYEITMIMTRERKGYVEAYNDLDGSWVLVCDMRIIPEEFRKEVEERTALGRMALISAHGYKYALHLKEPDSVDRAEIRRRVRKYVNEVHGFADLWEKYPDDLTLGWHVEHKPVMALTAGAGIAFGYSSADDEYTLYQFLKAEELPGLMHTGPGGASKDRKEDYYLKVGTTGDIRIVLNFAEKFIKNREAERIGISRSENEIILPLSWDKAVAFDINKDTLFSFKRRLAKRNLRPEERENFKKFRDCFKKELEELEA